jgi:cytochrome c biogenesis factor
MRKIIIGLLIAVAALRSAAQQTEVSIQKLNVDYFKKSKKQRNTGLILLGSGVTMFTVGTIAMQHSQSKGENEFPFVIGGLVTTIASVPFFISAAVNKHKANISMKRDAFMIAPNQRSNLAYNSISFQLNL